MPTDPKPTTRLLRLDPALDREAAADASKRGLKIVEWWRRAGAEKLARAKARAARGERR